MNEKGALLSTTFRLRYASPRQVTVPSKEKCDSL